MHIEAQVTCMQFVIMFSPIMSFLIVSKRWYLRKRQSRQYARALKWVDKIPFGVICVDCFFNITALSPTMLAMIQDQKSVTKGELLGKSYELISDTRNLDIVCKQMRDCLNGQVTLSELIHVNEQIFLITSYHHCDELSGEVIGVISFIQKICKSKMLRTEINEMERLSLVGQMAAGITHEIRNPMAVIRGFLQLMKEKSAQELHHYYQIVLGELDRANEIINDFLSLAQNRMSAQEEHDLHDVIHQLGPLLWADANLRGQVITFNLCEVLPKLRLNVKEIKQLILNLSRNAMEAMGKHGVLTIETRITTNAVQLLVHDTGPGIDKETLNQIFNPFYTTKSNGTGLGLSLSKNIAERHQGKITVEVHEGKGTTFIVSFESMDCEKYMYTYKVEESTA